jgi:hypothetical protein
MSYRVYMVWYPTMYTMDLLTTYAYRVLLLESILAPILQAVLVFNVASKVIEKAVEKI